MQNPNPADFEIVCDLNGFISNFWRAIQHDPEAVAYYADYPTIHQDLTARHKWLKEWGLNNLHLVEDPEFYDCRVAGWWVWGMSLWIGGEFCQINDKRDLMPITSATGGGVGVNAQKKDKRPLIKASDGGSGVSHQDKRPYVRDRGDSGRGVSAQMPHVSNFQTGQHVSAQKVKDKIPYVKGYSKQGINSQGARLMDWFEALSERLKTVVVINRSWESAVTPTILADTDSIKDSQRIRAVFLDPPYLTANRSESLYQSDADKTSDSTAQKAYEWAVEYGKRDTFRIAYCCHDGDFEVPEGWTSITTGLSGIRDQERRKTQRDLIMFSPACKQDKQTSIFEGWNEDTS